MAKHWHWYEEFDFEFQPKPKPQPPARPLAEWIPGSALVGCGGGIVLIGLAGVLHWAAREYGVLGMLWGTIGLGAVSLPVVWVAGCRRFKVPLSGSEVFSFGYLGGICGLLSCVIVVPALIWFGYEVDPQARRQHDARWAALDAALLRVASRPLPPSDRLDPGVVAALERLPDHPLDRIATVAELIKRLGDPDPVVQAEVVLALGRYEGLTSQILPLLHARINDPDPRMRAAATVALAGMRPWTAELEQRIFARLADPDVQVQNAAVTAVVRVSHFLSNQVSRDQLQAAARPGQLTTRRKIDVVLKRLAPP